jgi:hypothetical protein
LITKRISVICAIANKFKRKILLAREFALSSPTNTANKIKPNEIISFLVNPDLI